MIVSAEAAIRSAPEGSCLWSAIQRDDHPRELAVLIRETRAEIDRLAGGSIAMRVALLEEDGVFLVPILTRLRGGPPYEAWLNPEHEDARAALELLAEQSDLVVALYPPTGKPRILGVPSLLGATARRILDSVPPSKPAGDVEAARANSRWESAREAIYSRHPNAQSLWDSMDERDERGSGRS